LNIIEKKNAMKAFYYLMAVDGEVSGIELDKFDEIGREIDNEFFDDYKESIVKECRTQIATASGADDYYDVIQEGLDEALLRNVEKQNQGITVRLLVWNMLAIAISNDDYSEVERRIINHVVRTMSMDKSVFLEMEQLIKTASSVEKESAWIKASGKTYAEVRPIVEELEKRQKVIIESAKALIEDEIELDEPYVDDSNSGIFVNVTSKIGEKISPIATDVGTKTKKVFGKATAKIGEKVAPITSGIGTKADNLLGSLKNHKKDGNSTTDSKKL